MRFLRGIGLGLSMFVLWVVASIFGAMSFMSEYGFDREFELGLVSPLWAILMIVGFFGMFIGPIYYWVIEPMREKGHPKQPYYPSNQPVQRVSTGQVASFCTECGTPNENMLKFCGNCGANLILK